MLFSNQKLITNNAALFLTDKNIKIKKAPPLTIQTDLKFNPATYSPNPRSRKNLFKMLIITKNCYKNLFNTKLSLKSFYFFNIKKDPVKFRKRKNIFFNLTCSTTLSGDFFFKHFSNFLLNLLEVSYILSKYYNLHLGFISFTENNNVLTFTFKNLNYISAFLFNENFSKTTSFHTLKVNFNNTIDFAEFKNAYLNELIYILNLYKKI